MTQQGCSLRGSGSMAGRALVTLGTFFLYEDLAGLLVRIRDFSGVQYPAPMGTFPAILLSASMIDGHRFLADLLHRLLISCWPLLLVASGTVLSRIPSLGSQNRSKKMIGNSVDPALARSTSK